MSIFFNKSYLENLRESGVNFFLKNSPKKFYEENIKDYKKLEIIDNLNEISELDELKNFIKNSNVCKLKKKTSKTVFSDGNPNSKVMLIGEAPGADEDRIGKPFVGQAGKLLDKMLAAINLDRNNVYITNIVPWRPPNNRTPSTEEILQCLPFIQKHIEILSPKIIILLGGTAAKAILINEQGITKLRGKWYEYKNFKTNKNILTRPIYHPAFLLRSPNYKKETWEDLKKIKIEIEKLKNEK